MHGFARGARSFVRLSLYSFVVFLLVSSSGLFIASIKQASALTHLPPEKKTPLLHLAEKQLLKMMDLSTRPSGRSRSSSADSGSKSAVSVPAVMLHLQRAQETANQDASWFGQSPELADRALILTGSANTVRSQLQVESGHSSPFPDLKLLVFNVSIPANEMLLEAKFFLSDSYAVSSTSLHTNQNYVHHHHHLRRRPHPSSFSSSSSSPSSSITTKTQSTSSSRQSFKVPTQSTDDSSSSLRRVTLFDVLSPPPAFTSEWSLNDLIARSIDTAVIDLSQPVTWPHFDVTPALQRWLSHPGSFHGLAVHMTHVNGSKVNQSELVLEASSSSSSPSSSSSSSLAFAMGRVDPVLLTYTSRRSSEKKQPHGEALNRVKRRSESATSGRKTHRRKGKRDACRRHSMYIDFTDVGWNDWIVAPLGYHAYVCLGECPYPLGDHLNTTNHAIVQTLVNSINPSAVPKACCVPTELSPISMLYVDEDDRIVLKNYQDMVVEGCGCR